MQNFYNQKFQFENTFCIVRAYITDINTYKTNIQLDDLKCISLNYKLLMILKSKILMNNTFF